MCDKPIHSRSNIDMMAGMILVYPPGYQEILVKVMPRGGAASGEPVTQTRIKRDKRKLIPGGQRLAFQRL